MLSLLVCILRAVGFARLFDGDILASLAKLMFTSPKSAPDDARTDEDQLGVPYAALEEAMEHGTGLGVEVLKKFNTQNQHKMQPIPTFKL